MKIGNLTKQNASPLIKNKLLTLKRSFSPTLLKVLLQNRKTPQPPQEDSHSSMIRIELFVPFSWRRLQWDRADGLRMQGWGRGRGRTVPQTLWNDRKETQCKNLTNDQFNICLSFFYIHILYISFTFCCLHNETPCIGWEIQKRTSNGKRWGRMRKLKKISIHISRMHIRVSVPPYTHCPTYSHHSRSSRAKLTTASCLGVSTLCCSTHSALSPFHFRLANHGDTIWWCDIYALSGWSLFTCRGIRASCL